MPGNDSSIQAGAEVRRRAERFASLRAAQRALSRAVHPRELAEANQQARELVIQLQELSGRVQASSGAIDREAFVHIDGLLDQASQRLLGILDRIDIAALRSSVPPLLAEHPEDVRGLVDVLAEGELANDDDLRKLEYLVTMLCSEDRDGRRVLVREPADVSARLRLTARELGGPEESANERERRLGDAIAQLLRGSADVGAVRDEMREFKETMGRGLLHPRVLAAAIAYNVAMANQVSGLVDGSRSIDRLAEELLTGTETDAASATAGTPAEARDPVGSPGFEALVQAFRGRITGGEGGSLEARRVVDSCALDRLLPVEVEAFELGEEGQLARLTRSAVVVGLVCRNPEDVDAPLRSLGLDPDLLASDGVASITREMTALARKLFADSEYDAAFHVSEVKTRNLSRLASPGPGAGRLQGAAPRPQPRTESAHSTAAPGWGISLRQALLGMLAVGILLAAFLWLPSGWSGAIYSQEDLAAISPFLESGYRAEQAGQPVFVGRLHPSWDYLGTPERQEVAGAIGQRFQAEGVSGVALSDAMRRRQVEWQNGELSFVAPRLQ